MVNNSSNINK